MPFKKKRRSRSRAIAPRRRSYHRPRWFHRRHRPSKIPLIPTIAFGAATLGGSSGGWSSPLSAAMSGSMECAIQSGIRNLTGMRVGVPNTGFTQGFEWNIIDTINPFNLNEAVGLKGLMWGTIADMALGAFGVKRRADAIFKRLPFIKRFSL